MPVSGGRDFYVFQVRAQLVQKVGSRCQIFFAAGEFQPAGAFAHGVRRHVGGGTFDAVRDLLDATVVAFANRRFQFQHIGTGLNE